MARGRSLEVATGRRSRQRQDRYVFLSGNEIRFVGKVNAQAHREFLSKLEYCSRKGFEVIELDFRSVKNAFPNGMIPIIANVDRLKRQGRRVQTRLPSDTDTRRLFLKTNWAFLLDPENHKEEITTHHRHLASRRFRDASEQQQVVNEFVDIAVMNLRLKRSVIAGLEWSINEITDNVLNHAESSDGGVAQVSTFKSGSIISYAVADSGVGVYQTLKSAIPTLRTDINAIGEALKAGVTRNPEVGQGNGLAGALRISTMSKGSFAITSGRGHINYYEGSPRRISRPWNEAFEGTLVCADIGVSEEGF